VKIDRYLIKFSYQATRLVGLHSIPPGKIQHGVDCTQVRTGWMQILIWLSVRGISVTINQVSKSKLDRLFQSAAADEKRVTLSACFMLATSH